MTRCLALHALTRFLHITNAQGTEGHNTAQIGGFVMLPPVITAAVASTAAGGGNADAAADAAAADALLHLSATHDSRKLAAAADRYARVMARLVMVRLLCESVCTQACCRCQCCCQCRCPLAGAHLSFCLLSYPAYPPPLPLQGEPLAPLLEAEASRLRFSPSQLADKGWDDVNIVHSVFGSACYIESSWPAVIYLAWKYAGGAVLHCCTTALHRCTTAQCCGEAAPLAAHFFTTLLQTQPSDCAHNLL